MVQLMPLPAVRGVLPFAVAVLSAWLVVIAASAAKLCPKHVRARAQDGCRSSAMLERVQEQDLLQELLYPNNTSCLAHWEGPD